MRVGVKNLTEVKSWRAIGAPMFDYKMNNTQRSFPLRTLIICFTIWLIATEILVFDQVRFDTRIELLDQTARALRGPKVVVPGGRPPNLPDSARMEQL